VTHRRPGGPSTHDCEKSFARSGLQSENFKARLSSGALQQTTGTRAFIPVLTL